MQIKTTRFGIVELEIEDQIEMPEGLLGFQNLKKFVLVDDPNDEIFVWLQSCENPDIAFPVLEPELFIPRYSVKLTKTDMEGIRMGASHKVRYFTIITIPADVTQMTANLKAPVVINVDLKVAKQCVLQDNDLPIREPIFSKLQQRIVQFPTEPIKGYPSDSLGSVKVSPVLHRPEAKV